MMQISDSVRYWILLLWQGTAVLQYVNTYFQTAPTSVSYICFVGLMWKLEIILRSISNRRYEVYGAWPGPFQGGG